MTGRKNLNIWIAVSKHYLMAELNIHTRALAYIALFALALAGAIARKANAATYYVNPGESIQAVIDDAAPLLRGCCYLD